VTVKRPSSVVLVINNDIQSRYRSRTNSRRSSIHQLSMCRALYPDEQKLKQTKFKKSPDQRSHWLCQIYEITFRNSNRTIKAAMLSYTKHTRLSDVIYQQAIVKLYNPPPGSIYHPCLYCLWPGIESINVKLTRLDSFCLARKDHKCLVLLYLEDKCLDLLCLGLLCLEEKC